jgi:hypothetical protein
MSVVPDLPPRWLDNPLGVGFDSGWGQLKNGRAGS